MNIDFNRLLYIEMGSYQRPIPLTNSFGVVFPVLADDILAGMFSLKGSDQILDIGGGSNPFSKATVVTEPYLEMNTHRSGVDIKSGVDYVECFAEEMPFADKQFDFAIARQVFEHVTSPKAACDEMIRVSKRGFIETPQKNYELLCGPNPSHNWFVSVVNNKLIFERRMFVRHPLRHLGLSAVPSSPEGQFLLHWELKNLTNVQFYWEDEFEYEVVDSEAGFDYSNPDHAAEAHLDVAICSLLQGGYYLWQRESDARVAVRLRPDWALAHNTLGIILWKQGKTQEALSEFTLAAQLEKRDEYKYNAGLEDSRLNPALVDFEYALAMDEKFFSNYGTCCSFNIPDYLQKLHVDND